jgi:hypothetical protein
MSAEERAKRFADGRCFYCASAKCILVTGSLQECVRGCGV